MNKPFVSFIDEEGRKKVLDQVFWVMENVGEVIQSPEAKEILVKAGCSAEGDVVKFPRAVVEAAIESAPKMLEIYTRTGEKAMDLGGYNSYFGPGPTCPNYFDPQTGEQRPARKEDAATTAKISDALPNIDFVMSLVMIGDKTPQLADIHEIDAMVRNTVKPLASWAFNKENLQVIIDMCSVVAGGLDKLQEKPFLIIYAEPTTPLVHTREALEKVMLLAENKIPCIYTPGMIAGGTAPVTIAAALSVGISETLTGLVLHQAVCPGAPFIAGVGGGPMDMQTMQHSYGAPEWTMIMASQNEVLKLTGLPVFGAAGASDSQCIDAQAASEAMSQCFAQVGVGANLIHDIGFMDLGLTGSPVFLTLCDDIIGHVRRIEKGVPTTDEDLAPEVIAAVGPGGNFLTEEHTLDNYSENIWNPALYDRHNWADWDASGRMTMEDRARIRMRTILDTHTPEPIPDDVLATLDAMVAKAEAAFVG